jgi:hypothetical protein
VVELLSIIGEDNRGRYSGQRYLNISYNLFDPNCNRIYSDYRCGGRGGAAPGASSVGPHPEGGCIKYSVAFSGERAHRNIMDIFDNIFVNIIVEMIWFSFFRLGFRILAKGVVEIIMDIWSI